MKGEPHVIVLPFPAQGHIKPMLFLAELLCHAGVAVTFVNTHHNHRRLATTVKALSARSPSLHFESIPDGLPDHHPRVVDSFGDFISSLETVTQPLFRDFLSSLQQNQPATCIIADGVMTFAIDVATEFGIPAIYFRTSTACYLWALYNAPKLIQDGQIPFSDEDLDKEVTGIAGMQGLIRCRDLPSICRFKQMDKPIPNFFLTETQKMTKASALILNTIQDLEAPILSHILTVMPKTFTIGPVHLLSQPLRSDPLHSSSSNGSLWEEDRKCMVWLDSQPSKSVVYVSFGSLVRMTKEQAMEFWHGLNNSGKPFLWVLRSDALILSEGDENGLPEELVTGTRERGCIMSWVPQEEVLAHGAVGGFLTHGGWNSILEAIVAGVPMICWPHLADQQLNSRWVSEVWGMGFDMKDTCDRSTIAMMVRDLMEDKRGDVMKSMGEISRIVRDCAREGGSSFCNLEKLVDYIRALI